MLRFHEQPPKPLIFQYIENLLSPDVMLRDARSTLTELNEFIIKQELVEEIPEEKREANSRYFYIYFTDLDIGYFKGSQIIVRAGVLKINTVDDNPEIVILKNNLNPMKVNCVFFIENDKLHLNINMSKLEGNQCGCAIL